MRAYALSILLSACVVQPVESTTPEPASKQRPGPSAHYDGEVRSETGSVMEVIPFQRWSNVPSYVVGILYEAGAQEWGGSIGHGRNAHTGTGRNEYKFSFDGTSPYALYFESDGRGENYLTGWGVPVPGQKYEQYDAAMFDSSTPALAHTRPWWVSAIIVPWSIFTMRLLSRRTTSTTRGSLSYVLAI